MSYEQSAAVYDAIYTSKKDYRVEAERVHELIQSLKRTNGNDLLDVACGTGLHDAYLQEWYNLVGLDISPAQLEVARGRLPHTSFHQADMTNFDLGIQFDAVTCLFSAIGHLLTLEKLNQALVCMAAHLKPGGVLIVEPWFSPSTFHPGLVGRDFVDTVDLVVARVTETSLEGNISKLIMHHLVGRTGQPVESFVEEHHTALYTDAQYMDAFRQAGLVVHKDEQGIAGRGLFIGQPIS